MLHGGVVVDIVQGLGDSGSRCRRILPRVKRHCVRHERGRREPINSPSCADHAAQCARHQEPLRDTVRPREHQPLHAGQRRTFINGECGLVMFSVACVCVLSAYFGSNF